MFNSFANAPLLSLLLIFVQSLAGAQDFPVEKLTEGRCVAEAYSKNYLTDVDKSPIQFSCLYHCMDNAGKISDVTARHLFYKSTDEAEMRDLVCRGVIISYYRQDGKLRGDLTGVQGFWALLSDIHEIRKWSLDAGVRLPEPVFRKMRAKMNLDLLEVSVAYKKISPKFPEFLAAGQILAEIATGSDQGETYLQESLLRIRARTSQTTKTEHLIDLNISALGKFLI